MRNIIIVLFHVIVLIGCGQPEKVTTPIAFQSEILPKPALSTVNEAEAFQKFHLFWDYYQRQIKLNEDFLGYNKDGMQIPKKSFLQLLASGRYQPIRINPIDTIRYQLKTSPPEVEGSIADYMKMFAEQQLVYYHMEGKPVPKFEFVTIAGVKYTNENTKGKFLLLKCWFISCVHCVQEMPALNTLVENYNASKDIIFLSLAIDDQAPLQSFHKKTRFDYETVANQKKYMSDKLHVYSYPTHFLIDKAGNVVKVANTAEEIEMFLARLYPLEH